jgi:hypothetical protein
MDCKSTELPLDRRIAVVARTQHEVVGRAQLFAIGLSKAAIEGRVRRGRLHRVHQGVYAVGGEGAALSHFSAAVLWGMLGERKWPVHVTAERRRRVQGLRVHEAPLEGERVRREGIVVTTPGRTLVDLADVAPPRLLERAIDEADYLRLDTNGLRPRKGRRGEGALSAVLVAHTPGSTRTRSELEELFLALCDEYGIERPEVNVIVEGYECDFVWRARALIVETDGGAAHGTAKARERDRIKDVKLLLKGWRVVRITWMRLLNEPDQVAAELQQLLTQASRPAAPASRR